MFTIKFYSADGLRQRIYEAESFTVIRGNGDAEITLHQKSQNDDFRVDIKEGKSGLTGDTPPCYQRAIIENSAGKTTEIIALGPVSNPIPRAMQSAPVGLAVPPA
jgi:hypothetical protein